MGFRKGHSTGSLLLHLTEVWKEAFDDGLKVSVNENFSTLLDFVFFNFWHKWVLDFILAEKENQKVLFNSSKMSLF